MRMEQFLMADLQIWAISLNWSCDPLKKYSYFCENLALLAGFYYFERYGYSWMLLNGGLRSMETSVVGTSSDNFGHFWNRLGCLQIWSGHLWKSWHSHKKTLTLITQKKLAGIRKLSRFYLNGWILSTDRKVRTTSHVSLYIINSESESMEVII